MVALTTNRQTLDRKVALKELQVRHADAAGTVRRFLREAEVTGNLEHPGVGWGGRARPGG